MDEDQEHIYVEHFMPHGITPKQFEKLETSAEVLQLDKGEAIFRKGETLAHAYLVVRISTQAHILVRHLTAQSTSAKTKGNQKLGGDSGAWVGEMSFLDRLWEKQQGQMERKLAEKKKQGEASKQQTKLNQDEVSNQQIMPPKTSNTKSNGVLYTVITKEKCTVWKWSFQEMENLMSSSTDLRGAVTRAMTSAVVGKVINMTVSRTNAMPTWSTWLSDWVRDDGAMIQIQRIQTMPEERKNRVENEENLEPDRIDQPLF